MLTNSALTGFDPSIKLNLFLVT